MTFTVLIEACGDQFAASVPGSPNARVIGSTRFQAIDALKVEIEHRIALGELLALDINVDTIGVLGLAGKYEGDPTLRAICDEAYEARDAERSQ